MNISKECLILNLQIGTWMGYKYDKMLTKKITDEAGARADAARVNKHLIAKEALSGISTAIGRIRAHFYTATLPWKDNGDRLLPRKNYVEFIAEHEKLRGVHDEEVRKFLDEDGYATAQEQSEFRMGSMLNLDDYPTVRELRLKFHINLDIDAVAKSYDYRLSDNNQLIQHRVNRAIESLWKRLAEPLEHFSEKINNYDPKTAKFRENTLDNLREMVELTKQLNFTGDEALEAIRAEIETKLNGYDAATLRKDDKLRASVGSEAARILETMRGFMTSMGGSCEDPE